MKQGGFFLTDKTMCQFITEINATFHPCHFLEASAFHAFHIMQLKANQIHATRTKQKLIYTYIK